MTLTKTKKAPKHLPKSFDEYKAIKDEIIEISEQRFENILNKRLAEFRKELLTDISNRFDPKFEAIDAKFDALESKFDAKFEAFESKFDAKFKMLIWFLGVSMTFVIGILSVILNKVLK